MPDKKINAEVAKLNLCDHCLGRLYGMLGHSLTNDERGRAIRVIYAMENNVDLNSLYPEECELCGGLFEQIDMYAEHILSLLKDYEFSTFSVGSKFPEEVLEKEKELREKYSSEEFGESIGREFNRELGKKIAELSGKEADLAKPDITIIVDTEYDDVRLEIKPLFIYGRYRKLIRGIPQTKWPSGKYKESVEELIARPVMEVTGGEGHALHGLGREDIDVRMLGNGRPFVLEIKRPKKRKINLEEMEKRINEYARGKVEVSELRFSDRDEIRKIKGAKIKKRYRIGVRVSASREEVEEALHSLIGKIRQRTPKRVAHRRADKVRVREVYEIKLLENKDGVWIIEVLAESGTYIKELMHGDDGRTKPSLAGILNKEVEVEFLDVIEILD